MGITSKEMENQALGVGEKARERVPSEKKGALEMKCQGT